MSVSLLLELAEANALVAKRADAARGPIMTELADPLLDPRYPNAALAFAIAQSVIESIRSGAAAGTASHANLRHAAIAAGVAMPGDEEVMQRVLMLGKEPAEADRITLKKLMTPGPVVCGVQIWSGAVSTAAIRDLMLRLDGVWVAAVEEPAAIRKPRAKANASIDTKHVTAQSTAMSASRNVALDKRSDGAAVIDVTADDEVAAAPGSRPGLFSNPLLQPPANPVKSTVTRTNVDG